MTPSPAPSPIVEQISAVAAAPWWGVPVTAGVFLLLGGVLTFLFTRWNDRTKYERERKREDVKELVELGAQLIAAGTKVREFAMLGLTRPVSEFAQMVADQGRPLMDNFGLAASRFRLIQPNEMNKVSGEYILRAAVMMLPPYAKDGQEWAVQEHTKASIALTDALRAVQGHSVVPAEHKDHDLVKNAGKAMEVLADEIKQEEELRVQAAAKKLSMQTQRAPMERAPRRTLSLAV